MDREYRTVLKQAAAEYEERKSRFIASVKPVSCEEEAVEFINDLKSHYWDASHNVYSYYIQGNTTVQRFSDDGEPSGTAGMPVLEVIRRIGVRNLAVVVTRYFGGTLLGAAGLIRAYGRSASMGIEAAGIVTKKLCTEVGITVEYTLFGKVQNMLISGSYTIKDTLYGQDVELHVYVPADEVEHFTDMMVEATGARILIEYGKNVYITLDSEGNLINA